MVKRANTMRRVSDDRALNVRQELEQLKRREDPVVHFGSSAGDTLDGFWFLGQPQAPQVWSRNLLTNLWFEAVHLDAASYDLIPVVKTLPDDRLTLEEKGLLVRKRREPLCLPVKVISTIDFPPLELMAGEGVMPDDTDLVILINHSARGTYGGHSVFVYFEECKKLKVRDKPFIRRFYTLAQAQENVYRVTQEKAETLRALDQLSLP